ncbi:MAG: triphosphoribosyl-dephospho-CoA synthase [Candidatus Eutrophobiaceae bacterium]
MAATLQSSLHEAFDMDLQALKPGNVGLHGKGHGMSVDDFKHSTAVAVPILCDSGLACGARVRAAVAATCAAVACNTNLGMLLLAAPLICAMERRQLARGTLRLFVEAVLGDLDENDTRDVFQAIALASPGGLGEMEIHDVRVEPECGILQAMREVSDWDSIAGQYVNGFEDVFAGSRDLAQGMRRWGKLTWAVTELYLDRLAKTADSHIIRKHGLEAAKACSSDCRIVSKEFKRQGLSPEMRAILLDLDREWKVRGFNPGTSADLVFASVLVYLWENVGVKGRSHGFIHG